MRQPREVVSRLGDADGEVDAEADAGATKNSPLPVASGRLLTNFLTLYSSLKFERKEATAMYLTMGLLRLDAKKSADYRDHH